MNFTQRQTIFTIFAVFFIVLLPFIVILSLGYGIDIQKGSVSNNLTVKLQTFPRNADVFVGDKKFETPAELSIPAGQPTQVKVEKANFFGENFDLVSRANENSTVRIEGLWLLPKDSEARFESDNNKILNILDKNYLILEKPDNGGYGIANYSFAGIRDEFIKIENPDKVKIETGTWQLLLQNVFWEQEQNLILYQKNTNQWEVIDLGLFPHKFVSIASLNKNQVLLLDSEGNLWFLNNDNKSLVFIENNISGLSFTESPDMIWILSQDSIFRFERDNLDPANINFANNDFSSSRLIFQATKEINPEAFNSFVTKNLFLGLVFKIGQEAIYIPDSNKESYKLIATDIKSLGTSGSTIFWLDSQNNIHTYNLLINQERLITLPKLNYDSDSEIILSYYSNWKRLFVYTQKQVATVWIDLEINNDSILNYSSFLWLDNQGCFGTVNNNYQFCTKDNALAIYKNNSFPF